MIDLAPIYDEGGVTIYCGDSAEILPTLPRGDLLLTDPPYGLGQWSSTGGQSLSAQEVKDVTGWDLLDPELITAAVGHCELSIVWGGNYFGGVLGPTRAPLIWDKAVRGMHFADGEMAWTNFDFGTLRIYNYSSGAARAARGPRVHPTQKPEALMAWSIKKSRVEPPGLIIDPFMGSGTTLLAARAAGFKAIGIEQSGKYCNLAIERLAQGALFCADDPAIASGGYIEPKQQLAWDK
jgi:site-specific DNA-methyltransferase (adenine-specific)